MINLTAVKSIHINSGHCNLVIPAIEVAAIVNNAVFDKPDGKRLFEDITFADSYGNRFTVLPDGSYVLCEDGIETVYGEAYIIENGSMEKICENGNSVIL